MKSKLFGKRLLSEIPFIFGVPAILLQLLFFYVPLLLIVLTSFVNLSEWGQLQGLTFDKIRLFLSPTYMKVIFSSILLGLGTASICLLVSYPLAYFMAIQGKKHKNLLLFLLIIPFWTNFLLHVYAWFFVLEREGLINSILLKIGMIEQPIHFLNSTFSVMVMMVYYYLPFMVLPIYSSLERFEYKLIEASLDLGASWFQTFRRIMLPLTIGGIRAGFFLVYIPAFGEFAIPELMGGDKYMFVGSVVSHYILGDQTGSLGAAFTVVACLCLLISAAAIYQLLNKIILPKKRNEHSI
ncbi:MAG: ABC transporter permease [Chlamydiae bacterium]|nr:ABC transporter permease [Chlamydiota bacterium]